MTIQEHIHPRCVTLCPAGDLDANSSIMMDDRIRQHLDAGQRNVHIDCRELAYISSAGLGVFISFMDEIGDKGGKIVFSGMSDNIFKVFSLLGLHQVMTIVPTAEEAEREFAV